MSELEVRRARMEVEKSAAEFERALDELREQVEDGVEAAREIRAKVKEPSELFEGFIDKTLDYARESARELFHELRQSAEEELHALDKEPLAPWAVLLGTGLALGFFLARSSRAKQTPRKPVAV